MTDPIRGRSSSALDSPPPTPADITVVCKDTKVDLDIAWWDAPSGGKTLAAGDGACGSSGGTPLSSQPLWTKSQIEIMAAVERTRAADAPLESDPYGNALIGVAAGGLLTGAGAVAYAVERATAKQTAVAAGVAARKGAHHVAEHVAGHMDKHLALDEGIQTVRHELEHVRLPTSGEGRPLRDDSGVSPLPRAPAPPPSAPRSTDRGASEDVLERGGSSRPAEHAYVFTVRA